MNLKKSLCLLLAEAGGTLKYNAAAILSMLSHSNYSFEDGMELAGNVLLPFESYICL